MKKRWIGLGCRANGLRQTMLGAVFTTACATEVVTDEPVYEVEAKTSALAIGLVWQGGNWTPFATATNYEVHTCFLPSGFEEEKRKIMGVVVNQWGVNSRLRFTGWGSCPDEVPTEWVPIELLEPDPDLGFGGVARPGVGSRVPQYPDAQMVLVLDPDKLKVNAVHEMGHVLGFAHEHMRADRVGDSDECEDLLRNVIPTWFLTEYDPNSVMNYCRDWNDNGVPDIDEFVDFPQLSENDIEGLQIYYGAP